MSLIKRALDKAEEQEKQDNISDKPRGGKQESKFEGITGLEILLGVIIILVSAFIGGQIILLITLFTG